MTDAIEYRTSCLLLAQYNEAQSAFGGGNN